MRLGKLRYVPWAVGLTVVAAPLAARANTGTGTDACTAATISAPAYASGARNTVTWGPGANASQFELEWASGLAPATDNSGAFLNAEGHLDSVSPSAFSQMVSGLSEAQHAYHVRSGGPSCSGHAWSNVVSTIQDATPPQLAITSSSPMIGQTTTVTGTASDPAGGQAPSGSGVAGVTATLTPVSGGRPVQQPATFDTDGVHWSATFAGVQPGLYDVVALATDGVGNTTSVTQTNVLVAAVG